MLAGAYPSDEFAELKARVTWDRVTDVVEGRRDARVVAVTSGGTIPDRGLFGVFLAGEAGTPGRRVGELDEEMVYELRAGMHGDVIVLGASQLARAGHHARPGHRGAVRPASPASCRSGRATRSGGRWSWGGRSASFLREAEAELARGERARARSRAGSASEHDLDELAARNLVAYLEEEREVAGALPTDRRLIVQRFRDELGDWRLVILIAVSAGGSTRRSRSPSSPGCGSGWASRPRRSGPTTASRCGCPKARARATPAGSRRSRRCCSRPPDEVEDLVVEAVGGSALFASRFRENAGRALLLPRRRPGARTPLWQQRQRAADLLQVASRYGSASRSSSRRTARSCPTSSTSTRCARCSAASSGGRSPSTASRRSRPRRSRRRCCSTTWPRTCTRATRRWRSGGRARWRSTATSCASCSGQEELRELLDPEALADLELSLQALIEERQADTAEHLHDLLRRLGDLSTDEIGGAGRRWRGCGRAVAARAGGEPARGRGADRRRGALDRDRGCRAVPGWRRGLAAARRPRGVPRARDRGARWAAGAIRPLPRAVPRARAGPALGAAARRRRGCAGAPARRRARCCAASSGPAARSASGAIPRSCDSSGAGRSLGSGARWSRWIRRRSAGSCRRGRASRRSGRTSRRFAARAALERLAEVVDQLAGVPIPASVLERDVLPARVPGYQPRLLDELGALGEVAWVGHGSLGRDDGRVVLHRPGRELLLGAPAGRREAGLEAPRRHPRAARRAAGASFFRAIQGAAARAGAATERDVLDALWDLVWAGEVTNDTFAPLRALRWKRPAKSGGNGARRPRMGRLTALGPPEAAGRWSLVGSGIWDATARPRPRARRSEPTSSPSPCSTGTASSSARP